jgi:hypothetical protein
MMEEMGGWVVCGWMVAIVAFVIVKVLIKLLSELLKFLDVWFGSHTL